MLAVGDLVICVFPTCCYFSIQFRVVRFVICLMALDVGDCQADGNTTEYDYTYTGTWSTGSTGTDQTDKPTVSVSCKLLNTKCLW